MRKNVTRYSQK